MNMIAIVDYGVGNIFSLCCSLRYIGADAILTSDAEVIHRADRVLLPGVGAFGDAAARLRSSGLWDVVVAEGKQKPLLGICLGMQLLLEKSYEYGEHVGLGLVRGSVVPIAEAVPSGLKIPHIGWNALHFHGEKAPIFKSVAEGEHVYFVHSYYATDCPTIATTEYGAELTAAVWDGGYAYGVQFHPEKSGEVGLDILRAFAEL